jgi:hypothetical protein
MRNTPYIGGYEIEVGEVILHIIVEVWFCESGSVSAGKKYP